MMNSKGVISGHFTRDGLLSIHLLCVLFGLGSWIAMTGLWVELPVLVQRLPEGWALASYLTVMMQIANIGPVAFTLANRRWPDTFTERSAIHAQMAVGVAACFILILFWHETNDIGGKPHSVALFVASFFLSIMDCTSSVVFLPYMVRFKEVYLTPYLAGEGLSGFLPSVVALAQGAGGNVECKNETSPSLGLPNGDQKQNGDSANVSTESYSLVRHVQEPRFSPELFFCFLLGMVLLSWFAFSLLDRLPASKKEQVRKSTEKKPKDQHAGVELSPLQQQTKPTAGQLPSAVLSSGRPGKEEKVCSESDVPSDEYSYYIEESVKPTTKHLDFLKKKLTNSKVVYFYLLFLQTWASIATFGVFPAIQPYSCLPYGNQPFHLAVTLSGMAYPAACLLAMFIQVRSLLGLTILSLFATLVSIYIMVTAVMSPMPPLVTRDLGASIMVLSWVVFVFVFSYVKTMVTVLLRELGHAALFWCGAVTQAGATTGALIMFVLVNSSQFFTESLCGV